MDEKKRESDRGKARKKGTLVRGWLKAKDKGPTQADCVAHGLRLAAMTGMFKKNGW